MANMISLQGEGQSSKECQPNLLPCGIDHSGPVHIEDRLWKPASSRDGKSTVFLRGRQLTGEKVSLPERYQGNVIRRAENQTLPGDVKPATASDDDEELAPVVVMEEQSTFDSLVVWEHGKSPDQDNSHIKAVREWISFAEAINLPEDSSDDVQPSVANGQPAI